MQDVQDRGRVEARALYLASLYWPSVPWTDTDHARFKAASDQWDELWGAHNASR